MKIMNFSIALTAISAYHCIYAKQSPFYNTSVYAAQYALSGYCLSERFSEHAADRIAPG
jgi:hypothetical protein